jgi:5-methylthioadenosine/S-adenosylhomocysteine deaminase
MTMRSHAEKEQVSLVLNGAWVVTMDPQDHIFAPGAVAVRGPHMVAVGTQEDIARRFVADRVLDYPQGLILPGLINAHTHAAMSVFRGLADDLPLEEWLNSYMFPGGAPPEL